MTWWGLGIQESFLKSTCAFHYLEQKMMKIPRLLEYESDRFIGLKNYKSLLRRISWGAKNVLATE